MSPAYKLKGEITVFLSLVFVLMLSFILSMLDGAILQASKSEYRLMADLAIFSVFGEYQKELLEEYGIFSIEGTYEKGVFDERDVIDRMRYYGSLGMEHEIVGIQFLTDNFGSGFREQVLHYMEDKYMISDFREITGLSSQWSQQEIEGEEYLEEERGLLSELSAELEENEVELPTEDNAISHVTGLKNRPILSLVTPGEMTISNRTVSLDHQPSRRNLRKGRGELPMRGSTTSIDQQWLYQNYLFENFYHATSEDNDEINRSLVYEIEYMLEGKDSDAKNLEAVALKIFLVRYAANVVHVFGCKEKKDQAKALASVLAAAIKLPRVETLIKYALLLAWAFGESIVDIRALLSGKKVPTLKKKDDWQLSLSNLLTLGTADDKEEGKDSEKGLDYEGYLRILLLAANNNSLTMRTLDRVEQNMIFEKEKSFFRVDNCIVKLKVHNQATIRNDITYDFPLYFSYL